MSIHAATPLTIEDFRVFVQEHLPGPSHPEGDWLPFASWQDETGVISVGEIDPSVLADQSTKEVLAVEIAHRISASTPRFAALVFSVWMAKGDDGRRPSESPLRQEALIATYAGRDEGPTVFFSPIERVPGGPPQLGPWEQVEILEGLWPAMLEVAFRVAIMRPDLSELLEVDRGALSYSERRAIAFVLGINPGLIRREPLFASAAA